MILAIKTDSETAVLILYRDGKEVARHRWEAGRQLAEQLQERVKAFINDNGQGIRSLKGLIYFRGPGSFTGLRIGVTVANTLSYALEIPIVGSLGGQWEKDGLRRLGKGENDTQVLPMYGSGPNITKPRK